MDILVLASSAVSYDTVFLLMFQGEMFEPRPLLQAARGLWGRCQGGVWSFGASSLHPMDGNKTPQLFVQLGYELRFLPAQLIA